jgi:hypothetical protein
MELSALFVDTLLILLAIGVQNGRKITAPQRTYYVDVYVASRVPWCLATQRMYSHVMCSRTL